MGGCEMNEADFQWLQTLPGNQYCMDCGQSGPDWGAPDFGILFCFQCSGIHRGLGTHISFVRSVRMDHWTDRQIQLMKTGGNDACRIFLQERGVDLTITRPASRAMIQARYDCPAAVLYKQVLQARADGRPEPTDLTNNLNNMRGSENTTGPPSSPLPPPLPPVKRKMEGFGNTTPPPSSNGSGLVPLKPWLWAVPTVAAAAVAYVILSHYGGA